MFHQGQRQFSFSIRSVGFTRTLASVLALSVLIQLSVPTFAQPLSEPLSGIQDGELSNVDSPSEESIGFDSIPVDKPVASPVRAPKSAEPRVTEVRPSLHKEGLMEANRSQVDLTPKAQGSTSVVKTASPPSSTLPKVVQLIEVPTKVAPKSSASESKSQLVVKPAPQGIVSKPVVTTAKPATQVADIKVTPTAMPAKRQVAAPVVVVPAAPASKVVTSNPTPRNVVSQGAVEPPRVSNVVPAKPVESVAVPPQASTDVPKVPEAFATLEAPVHLADASGSGDTLQNSPLAEPLALPAVAIQFPEDMTEPVSLSVPQILEQVVSDNLDIQMAKSQVGRFRGAFVESLSEMLPSVSAFTGLERFEGGAIVFSAVPFDVNRTTWDPTLRATYEMNLGGRSLIRAYAQKKAMNAQKRALDRQLQKSIYETLETYLTWQQKQSLIQSAQASVQEATSTVNLWETRLKSGVGTQLDLEQSRSSLADAQNALWKYERDAKGQEFELVARLNLPMEYSYVTNDETLKPILYWDKGEMTKAELFALAKANRPDLRQLKQEIAKEKANLLAAITEYFPTVNLDAYIRGIGPELNNDALRKTTSRSLDFNVDLLRNLGVGVAGRIMQSRAAMRMAIQKYEKQSNTILQDVATAWENYVASQRVMETSTYKLKALEEAYRVAQARIKMGVGINLELVQAQTDLVKARQSYFESILDYNTSQLKLLYETGVLTSSQIIAKHQ